MDKFDDNERNSPRRVLAFFWNCGTIVLLFMTLCIAAAVITIFIDPYSSLNLFPPPPPPQPLQLPSPTPTPIQILPPTWTPIPSNTPLPTATPQPSPTFTSTLPPTPTETSTPTSLPPEMVRYALSAGSPKATNSTAFHPQEGCKWMGVAGQVLDQNGSPVPSGSVLLVVQGFLGDQEIDLAGMAGTAPQYGPAGYEIVLGDVPFATQASLWIQLFDPQGQPLTDRIFFDTYGTCEQNLVLINFTAIKR
ncbi:MAG: hypothetical protein ACOY16_11445 [Chloroflexota bacterium]